MYLLALGRFQLVDNRHRNPVLSLGDDRANDRAPRHRARLLHGRVHGQPTRFVHGQVHGCSVTLSIV